MSVVFAKGYSAGFTSAGFRNKKRDDMAIVISEVPAICAGTFTLNVVKAAPVIWDKNIVKAKKSVRAILVNSGIANACTGEEGDRVCKESAQYASEIFGFGGADEVLVSSTGVIGMQIPIEKIKVGVDAMHGATDSTTQMGHGAAKAIMTTDTKPKEAQIQIDIKGTKVSIGGMAKGSGMIHPNMGTMLSFITTDVDIDVDLLNEALLDSVSDTYNMISVDGDTSTNDTCLVLANGMAKNSKITSKDDSYYTFLEALKQVNEELAKMMAGDGEGATALFETKVVNAKTKDEAKILAKSVITSSLTKAAIFGHDANWGRILCALGYAGVDFDPNKVDLSVESANGFIKLVENGVALDYSEEEATNVLSSEKVSVICDMKMGSSSSCAWGCDLTYDYVKINADYRS